MLACGMNFKRAIIFFECYEFFYHRYARAENFVENVETISINKHEEKKLPAFIH